MEGGARHGISTRLRPFGREPAARVRRLVRMHLLLAAALFLYTFVIGRCPIRWLTGVPCPGLRDDPRPHPRGASGLRRRVLLSSALVRRPAAVLYLAHQDAWRLRAGSGPGRSW